MTRKVRYLLMLFGSFFVLFTLSGCEKSDQDVLIQFPWHLKSESGGESLGTVKFTATKMILKHHNTKQSYSYSLNDDDIFMIKSGKFAGKYVLETDATDYELKPYKKAAKLKKLTLIRND